jgi:PE-PPE domain
MGIYYLHGDYFSPAVGTPILHDEYGDTKYYLIPTDTLPLLMPLQRLPFAGPVVAATFDAPLRVLVEAGYDRTTSPGQPTGFRLLYVPNLIDLGVNLIIAIPTGLDDGSQELGFGRPFRTEEPGPYGVGGPAVTMDPTTNEQNQQLGSAAETIEPSAAIAPKRVTPEPITDEQNQQLGTPSAAVTTRATLPRTRGPIGSNLPQMRDLTSSVSEMRGPIGSNLPRLKDLVPSIRSASGDASNTSKPHDGENDGGSDGGTPTPKDDDAAA